MEVQRVQKKRWSQSGVLSHHGGPSSRIALCPSAESLPRIWGFVLLNVHLFYSTTLCGARNWATLPGKAQQPQERCCPFLSVCVGFLCVQTVVWLPENLQGVRGPCSIRQVQRPVVRWPPAVLRICWHLQVEVRYMRSVNGFFLLLLALTFFFLSFLCPISPQIPDWSLMCGKLILSCSLASLF